MVSIDDLVVLYDNEIGVIWAPEYAEVRATTPSHAQLIKEYIQKCRDKELKPEELERFTKYILKTFKGSKKLKGIEPSDICETTALNRVEFIVTNSCNLKCKYCYADGGSYGCDSHYISPADAGKYIDALINSGYTSIKEIMFFGGEPTLFPETINEICKSITKRYEEGIITSLPTFTMVTNGTLIDDYVADIIAKYHIVVTISIDGPKGLNDSLRVDYSGAGTYDRVTAGIRLLKERGINIRLIEATYTINHKKLGYSREWVKEYLSSTFDVKDVLIADCEDIAFSQGYACDDIEELIGYVLQRADQTTTGRLIKGMGSKTKYSEYSCEGGFKNLSIIPGGNVYPCHMYLGRENYQIATLKDGKYEFNEKRYDLLKSGTKHSKVCEKCWAKFYCSMCPAIIALNESSLDYMCCVEKEAQKRMVLKYAKSVFLYNKNKKEEEYARRNHSAGIT